MFELILIEVNFIFITILHFYILNYNSLNVFNKLGCLMKQQLITKQYKLNLINGYSF